MFHPGLTRRPFTGLLVAAALGAVALAASSSAHAQAAAAPGSLRFVVPFPAGGTADVLPRILSEKLRERFPGGVVVENRAGAGGNIGAEVVFRSAPDGSVLMASPPGPIAINHNLYPKLGFDPTKWVPVTVMASVPNVLAVRTGLPVNTVQEFVAYVKANAGKVSYASQGSGSTSHLTANMFMSLVGGDMLHIPYKGTAPALVDLMGGQVDVFFDNLGSALAQHRAGKIRILAVADEQRAAALPGVPTFAESGLKDMVAVTWFAVVAPPETPAAIVQARHTALAEALALPDVRQKFLDQGAEPRGWSPEQTGQFIRAETAKWQRVIKTANVKVD
ncbi:MAG: hypothetical protein RL227_1860 [Pseudomonadota bacterium]|jgi:tripartite-type tricarboxylate transporter receptor subunit TctC